MMKNLITTLLLSYLTIFWIQAQNDSYSKMTLQVNGIYVAPDEGGGIEGGELTMTNEFGFEIGVNYFFNKNISTEIRLGSSVHEANMQYSDLINHRYIIGDVSMIPVDLNLQYHFYLNKFQPYIGTGIHYSFFYVKEKVLLGGVSGGTFDDTPGFVLQGGINYNFDDKWFINLDLKKTFLSTGLTTYKGSCPLQTAAKGMAMVPCPDYEVEEVVNEVDIHPLSFGLGIGYKFGR